MYNDSAALLPVVSLCAVLLPGFKVASAAPGQEPPAGSVVSQSLEQPPPAAAACPIGYYHDNSSNVFACAACPLGSTTLANASTSINDCMVPPGYFVKAAAAGSAGQMLPCPTTPAGTQQEGYYRAGWKSFSEVASTAGDGRDVCSKCGEGVLSRAMDDDGSPTAAPGSKVASSPASCCECNRMA